MKHRTYHFIHPYAIFITFFILTTQVAAKEWHIDDELKKWRIVDKLTENPLQYGEAVAVSQSGETAAVSQALADCPDGQKRCGAVYVYVRNKGHWQQQAKLFASDAIQDTRLGGFDFFDRTIALNDDGTILAAATNPNTLGKGAVYVFARDGDIWHEQQKLTLPIALLPAAQICENNDFGRSLALSGDGRGLIVGATYECLAANTGAAYLFTKTESQWAAQTRLIGSHVEAPDDTYSRSSAFGSAVDIAADGNTLLIGSSGFPSDLAEAYIFVKNSHGAWVEQAILSPADFPSEFGYSVALSRFGSTALVGGGGAVYVYTNNSGRGGIWKQEAKLGSNITLRGFFGFSLDLDDTGSQAVIGDWVPGMAFLYTRVSKGNRFFWQPQQLLRVQSGGSGLGSSIAISGDAKSILVSDIFVTPPPFCKRADGTETGCGTVYTLQRD